MSKPADPPKNIAVELRAAQRRINNPHQADTGWFDDLFKRAAEHAAANGVPREEFDPLLRLVRSYVRGSYRDAPPGDVAWALTALTMVGRGALNPGRLLRVPGLRPDRRTVRWVRRHIADTIDAYLAWEQTIGKAPPELASPTEPVAITSLDACLSGPIPRCSTPQPAGAQVALHRSPPGRCSRALQAFGKPSKLEMSHASWAPQRSLKV
jgi:hypothetical protein